MDFIDILKDIMVDLNLNQSSLAKLVGVKQDTNYLSGFLYFKKNIV